MLWNITRLFLLVLFPTTCDGALRFAKSYGDHMVLQRGPQSAVIWGYTDQDFQTISANIAGINSTVTTISINKMWKLKLNPVTAEGPFNITVSSKAEGSITLHDVLFGDVWICSGSANMGFSMYRVNDSDTEISSATAYNKIRILHVLYEESDTSLIDLQTLHTPWSIPTEACDGALRFAKSYGDHMVLQRGPQSAVIWGYTDQDFQTISANIAGINSTVTTISINKMWKLKLNPVTAEGPFNITVSSKAEGSITLHDVLFGDVWICSGSANMGFSMYRVNDSDTEISSATAYDKIRILHVLYEESDTSLIDLQTLHTPWSIPTEDLVSNFSAVCYMYGEYLSRHHNYPIGLIETDSEDNDTSIQSWLSPTSVTKCGKPTRNYTSGAYNSMINPLLTMTIYGAIWFQGESDIEEASKYGCQLQTLINDWRTLIHHSSLGETSNTFPFGIVQIGPNFHNYNVIGPVPDLRWSQTAKVGYLPNPTLPNTFLALTVDLPEFTPSSHRLHPKYKQDVAERLGLASLAIAYGVKGIDYQGPFPTSFTYSKRFDELTMEFDQGKTVLDFRSHASYFDVCCSRNSTTTCGPHDSWLSTHIKEHSDTTVTIDTLSCYERHVVGVRYNWRESPCEFKMCQIYGRDNDLPVPQFSFGMARW